MVYVRNSSLLFVMKVKTFIKDGDIIIRAFDANKTGPFGHSQIDISVRHNGKEVFPQGILYCGVNQRTSIDGKEAKRLVLEAVSMKPGDTDKDYFADYTADQLAWCHKYGETIAMAAFDRFGEA